MNYVFFILIFIILLCFVLIWAVNAYNIYQNYQIKINEVESKIDNILRKRFDLLNKCVNTVKTNSDIEKILEKLTKLKSKRLTNFELDREIYDLINELYNCKENNKELSKCEDFIKNMALINETEAEISAYRKYYNDTITDYNKFVKVFPSNIIGLIFKYKERTYFDGKNMNDEIYNDFKLK